MAVEQPFSPVPRQMSSARLAVASGATGLIVGMLYGTQISNCPQPQLALGAHVQFMVAGMIGLLAGLVLQSQSLCHLENRLTLLRIIDLSHWSLLVPSGAEGFAAFYGLGMPLLAERYNIKWERDNSVFQALHYGPGVALMLGWMSILYGVWRAGSKKMLEKTV